MRRALARITLVLAGEALACARPRQTAQLPVAVTPAPSESASALEDADAIPPSLASRIAEAKAEAAPGWAGTEERMIAGKKAAVISFVWSGDPVVVQEIALVCVGGPTVRSHGVSLRATVSWSAAGTYCIVRHTDDDAPVAAFLAGKDGCFKSVDLDSLPEDLVHP